MIILGVCITVSSKPLIERTTCGARYVYIHRWYPHSVDGHLSIAALDHWMYRTVLLYDAYGSMLVAGAGGTAHQRRAGCVNSRPAVTVLIPHYPRGLFCCFVLCHRTIASPGLQSMRGNRVVVELKNDVEISGVLEETDQHMKWVHTAPGAVRHSSHWSI